MKRELKRFWMMFYSGVTKWSSEAANTKTLCFGRRYTFFDIFNLLKLTSEKNCAFRLKQLSGIWSKAFFDCFNEELHQAFHAVSWSLNRTEHIQCKKWNQHKCAKSFHAILKRLSEWKEISMAVVLYGVQKFYWQETLHGLCRTS